MNLFTFVFQVVLQTCTSSTEVIFSILPSVNPCKSLCFFSCSFSVFLSTHLQYPSMDLSCFLILLLLYLFIPLSLSLWGTLQWLTPPSTRFSQWSQWMNDLFSFFPHAPISLSVSTTPFFHWGSLTMFTLSLLISVCTWLLLCVYAQKVVCLWVS